jgi:hypothetical protein
MFGKKMNQQHQYQAAKSYRSPNRSPITTITTLLVHA